MENDDHLQAVLIRRIGSRISLSKVREITGVEEIVVAGGSMLDAEPHDFDVYSATDEDKLDLDRIKHNAKCLGWTYVTDTKNALTMKDKEGRTFQFCTFCRENPQKLIEAFDFAHCQVGVSNWNNNGVWKAYYTDNFLQAMASQRTFFVSSPYPMGALCRVVKYAKYGYYGKDGRAWIGDVFKILKGFVDRGFRDYEDFKDQVDAVDLGYEGDEMFDLWKSVASVLHKEVVPPADDGEKPAEDPDGFDNMPF